MNLKFLVFGNDRHVPVVWLERYGTLASGIAFYFLGDDDRLDLLSGQAFQGQGLEATRVLR